MNKYAHRLYYDKISDTFVITNVNKTPLAYFDSKAGLVIANETNRFLDKYNLLEKTKNP